MALHSSWPPRRTSLLPTGSPFSWGPRERVLYIQLLSIALLVGANIVFLVFDGWPFVPSAPAHALESATRVFLGTLLGWALCIPVSRRWFVRVSGNVSPALVFTVLFHAWTSVSLCYVMGLVTAPSAVLLLWTLLVGMILLHPVVLWLGIAGAGVSLAAVHVLSKSGILPFEPLFQASLAAEELPAGIVRRSVATVVLVVPLLVVGARLVGPWRVDDRSLHRTAQLDSLTGVYARSFALRLMREAVTGAAASSRPLAVLMFDLDCFKQVNDTCGHAGGDMVLKATTKAVMSTLRTADIIGRFGGEEFFVLLPGANLRRAIRVAERFRSAVEFLSVPGVEDLSVTISVGVAAYGEHGESLEALLRAADAALYKAKADGRNCVRTM